MLKRIIIGVLAALVLVQFFRPTPNVSKAGPDKDDLIVRYNPPSQVQDILHRACYDCHSNNTRYPWYAQVQPLGWWLASHINEGKRELDFSVFGSYPLNRQARKLDHISDEVTNHSMPLRSYTWIHRDARLTDEQVRILSEWSDKLHDQIAP